MPTHTPGDGRSLHRLATSLLVLSGCGYAAATVLHAHHPLAGYAAAFFEAAMVGAVADWFAVTALFRHPLGMPIWHTAIIPKNKDRIGENLANFLCEHFLRSEQIVAKLMQMDLPLRLAHWLQQTRNADSFSKRFASAAQWGVDALGHAELRGLLLSLTRKGLQRIDIAPLAGQLLSTLTHDRRHQALLDASIHQLADWLSRPALQEKITEVIAKEVRALRYLGLDQMAARMATAKLVNAISNTFSDMAKDPQHELRLRFDGFMAHVVQQMQHDPALKQRVDAWRDQLLSNPHVNGHVQQLWDEWLAWVADDLARDTSRLRAGLTRITQAMGERLAGDAALRGWLQAEVLRLVPEITESHREDIRQYLVQRVKTWDAQELSNELEAHIGRDLQFIRINGTVVGGLIGLLIHAATEWIRHHS